MSWRETLDFQKQLELEAIADEILERELLPEGNGMEIGTLSPDEIVLRIEVPYTFGLTVTFAIEPAPKDENDKTSKRLTASYITTQDDVSITDWTDYRESDAGELAENFVIPFIWRCFAFERENLVGMVPVDDSNVQDYIHWLPDFFLDEEKTYAIGINIEEEGGTEPCGAVVYSVVLDPETGEKLLSVDHVEVDPEYQDIGIATYVVNRLREVFTPL